MLGPGDLPALREVLAAFADAFEDPQAYASKPPSDEYLVRLLDSAEFLAVAAFDGTVIVGGLAGYVLRKWSVDCSPDHHLRGHEFRLWLKDPLALYGVKNAVLAPGYRSPNQ